MIIIRDVEQRTDDWFRLRAGVISGTGFKHIISPLGKHSKSTNYLYGLVGGLRRGRAEKQKINSSWVDRGTELEPEARDFYSLYTGNDVEEVSFVFKDDTFQVGCSPDGLIVGQRGGLEIKCLKLENHIKALYENEMPSEHIPQVQGCLNVTKYDWWDFLLYYPEEDSLLIRNYPDPIYQRRIEEELAIAQAKMAKIRARLPADGITLEDQREWIIERFLKQKT